MTAELDTIRLPRAAPEVRRESEGQEIMPLTGIRGLAAGFVVLFHYYSSWVIILPAMEWLAPLASRGSLGVDLFFILSGFILSHVYANSRFPKLGIREYGKFLWLRLARVFPNHLATLVFLVLLVAAARLLGISISGDYPFSGLPSQLAMTHAWPFLGGGDWNYPSWSISAEWFAYLFMFPVVWHFLRLNISSEVALVALAYGMLALFLASTALLGRAVPLLQVSCEFLSGGILFGAYRRQGWATRYCQRYVSGAFAVLIGFILFYPRNAPLASAIIILFFPVLLVGLTSQEPCLSRFLSTTTALWLGKISYALYMSHAIVQKLLKIALPSERYVDSSLWLRLLILAGQACLILGFAAGLYYLVEVPSRNLLRRLRGKT
jgi:peptidoglycan/LPS O-acetylase OafA/YrhL